MFRRRTPLLLRMIPAAKVPTELQQWAVPRTGQHDNVPVILLHGTIDSPGSWALLARELHERGRTVIVPNYGNRGTAALAESVRQISDVIEQTLYKTSASQVDIVGHSQGGLIAYLVVCDLVAKRRAAEEPSRSEQEKAKPPKPPIRTVISVAGSTKGAPWPRPFRPLTALGEWLPTALGGAAMAEQISRARAGDTCAIAPLSQVPEEELPRWINIVSAGDRIVPVTSALTQEDYPGATTITTETALGRSIMHWLQQRDPGMIKLIAEVLEDAAAPR